MTDTKRSLLSVAGGLRITTTLTIAGFTVESERARCILLWPACLLYRWIGFYDPTRREGMSSDALIVPFCLLVGGIISLTIYSFITYVVLCLISKYESS